MAKIKGFELKRVVNFRGHEGEDLIQGDVYYNGKLIGYYSQDAHGGMDIFDVDYRIDKELKNKIRKISDNYLGNVLFKKIDDLYNMKYDFNLSDGTKYIPKGYEYLFSDLVELMEHEKLYKKYSKKWSKDNIYIVYETPFDRTICGGVLPPKYKDKTYFEYKSLNDFVIN